MPWEWNHTIYIRYVSDICKRERDKIYMRYIYIYIRFSDLFACMKFFCINFCDSSSVSGDFSPFSLWPIVQLAPSILGTAWQHCRKEMAEFIKDFDRIPWFDTGDLNIFNTIHETALLHKTPRRCLKFSVRLIFPWQSPILWSPI